jgi:very-short-patch-repair endonuclease
MTDAETKIWQRLRAHRFLGFSFRRQFPIGRYVVDFACLEARLIIEIDGGQHASDRAAYDATRDDWLRSQCFRILRFWNGDVLTNLRGVLERVAEALHEPQPPSLTLPRKGGGDTPILPRDLPNSREPRSDLP